MFHLKVFGAIVGSAVLVGALIALVRGDVWFFSALTLVVGTFIALVKFHWRVLWLVLAIPALWVCLQLVMLWAGCYFWRACV